MFKSVKHTIDTQKTYVSNFQDMHALDYKTLLVNSKYL